MSHPYTGGPAFPTESATEFWSGMSLRDYFAAKAMQAIITNDAKLQRMDKYEAYLGVIASVAIAKEAYILADAMLEAGK